MQPSQRVSSVRTTWSLPALKSMGGDSSKARHVSRTEYASSRDRQEACGDQDLLKFRGWDI